MGIGRTNNYVESLLIAVDSKNKIKSRSWTPIIPNSRIIILPSVNKEISNWQIRELIKPSSKLLYACIGTGGFLLINGIIVLILWIKEQKNREKLSFI